MGKLILNANDFVFKKLKEKSTYAYLHAMRENASRGFETVFANNMQFFVTRLGIILSSCYNDKLEANTYLGSISYICNIVLKDKQLLKLLRAIDVNDSSNDGKHSLKNINISIEECLHQYNNMLNKIVDKTHLEAFHTCHVYANKRINTRDVPIIDEKKYHIYGNISGVNYQIKLCQDYKIDLYKKSIQSKITIYWPDSNPNTFIRIRLINTKTKKIITSRDKIDVSKPNSKVAIPLNLTEEDLDRRVLYCDVEIQLYKTESHSYDTGILFFKKTHYYDTDEFKAKKVEKISQFYSPNRCKE